MLVVPQGQFSRHLSRTRCAFEEGKVLTFMFLLMLSLSATAEVYTWIDENGERHFSDQPPADQNISAEVTREIELQNIDAGYPAGIVVNPTRKRRKQEKAQQKAAAAEKMNIECARARADLATLSSPVIFRDETGQQVRVSEKDRAKMENSLRMLIKEHCG